MPTPDFPVQWVIDADGTVMDTVTELEVREGCWPTIDSARVVWRKGTRLNRVGTGTPPDLTIPIEGAALSIGHTSGTAPIWNDFKVLRVSASDDGSERKLEIEGIDPVASRLARAIPEETSGYTGHFNPFGQGNRSSTATGGVYDRAEGSGNLWTQDQAIRAILKATGAPDDATTFAGLTRTGSWDTRGMTGMEAILTVLGVRGRRSFRRSGSSAVLVDLAPSAGLTNLDLNTFADLAAWYWDRDSGNTFSDLKVQGAPDVEVRTVEIVKATPDVSTGGLVRNWNATDEANADAGDQESPAYRRFMVKGFSFVDGSPVSLGEIEDRLPLDFNDLPSFEGSDGARVWAEVGGKWVSMRGQISVFGLDRLGIYIEGGAAWVSTWKSCTKLRITLAIRNGKSWTFASSGGSGTALAGAVTLRRDVSARRAVLVASSSTPPNATMLRVTSAGVATMKTTGTGDGNYYKTVGSSDLSAEASDLAPLVNRPRPNLVIVRQGLVDVWPVGTGIGTVTFPGIGTLTQNAAVVSRIFRDNGVRRTTTWTIGLPPFTLSARL